MCGVHFSKSKTELKVQWSSGVSSQHVPVTYKLMIWLRRVAISLDEITNVLIYCCWD